MVIQTTQIQINKYISEKQKEFENILLSPKNSLIISSCGTGKSYTTINTLKNNDNKFIFAVPNTAVKEQLRNEYDLNSTCFESLEKLLKAKHNFIVCCYESISKVSNPELLNDYTLVYDEYHSLINDIHYRDNRAVLYMLDYFKNVKFLTATPNNLIKKYDEVLEIKDNQQLNIDTYLISQMEGEYLTKSKYKAFINKVQEINNAPTLLIISNGIENLKLITNKDVIHSKNRNNATYKAVVSGVLPEGLTVSTKLFDSGLSLKNKEEVNLIIDFKSYDINKANLIQMMSRFRQSKKINVFVINRGEAKNRATKSTLKDWLNQTIERLNNGITDLIKEFYFNNAFVECITFNPITKKFEIVEELFPFVEQKINGGKNSVREVLKAVCKEKNWNFKNELKLGEIEEEEFQKTMKDNTPKEILKHYFVDGEEISKFGYQYLKYRVLKNDHNKEQLILEHNDNYYKLTTLINNNENIKKIISQTIIPKISKDNYSESIPKVLKAYFKLGNKFDGFSISEDVREALKQEILDLNEDTKYFSKARLKIAEFEPTFNPKRTITSDSTVREFIKFLGIKPTRKENEIIYK